jgi:predicted nucleic acid-binding protein
MIAVDTAIVVRYLTGDHPKQSSRARALIGGNDVFLSRTVMLECEWALRGVYGYSHLQVCEALRAFAGLPRVSVEDLGMVVQALNLAENGVDIADTLHLAAAGGCRIFVTFDQDFIKRARHAGLDKVSTP